MQTKQFREYEFFLFLLTYEQVLIQSFLFFLKSLFKVLFFCQAFVHKVLSPKISTNFDDIEVVEVSTIIFVNFCICLWNFFWVCLFPRNFWPIKEWRKIEKIVKNRLFHQNSQKSTNVDFFFQIFYYSSLILLLKCPWYDFGTHTIIFDGFMKIWKSIFLPKKTIFFKKSIFFQKRQLWRTLYRRRNMNTSSI